MHWLGSNVAVFVFRVIGGLCWPLVVARALEAPPPLQQRATGPQKGGPPADWGARLKLLPDDSPGAPGVPKQDASKGADPGGRPPRPAPLAIPLVPGYDSFGLNLPDHDVEGRLRSLFVIGAISRLDDRNVEIRESFLETYAKDGSPEFSIELPKATLDRFTRVLVARTPVTLRKAEFELKGASLEFNTVTKEGGLGGPVQMIIYNAGTAGAPQHPAQHSPPGPAPR